MPAYTVAASALALGVDRKWLDNALSHHSVPGVGHTARGVARTLAPAAVELLAVALELHRELGVPLASAIATAERLTRQPEVALSPALHLSADMPAIRRQVGDALRNAMEVAPSIRRGRPTRK